MLRKLKYQKFYPTTIYVRGSRVSPKGSKWWLVNGQRYMLTIGNYNSPTAIWVPLPPFLHILVTVHVTIPLILLPLLLFGSSSRP